MQQGINWKDWKADLEDALNQKWEKYKVWDKIKRLNIEITNRCQAKCVFCFREEFNDMVKPLDMPVEDVIRFIIEISDFSKKWEGLTTINLGNNGEPLLHPDVVEIVRFAKDYCKYIRISTNLDRLNKTMSKNLLDAGLNRICFSIDEIESARYQKIRKNLNWYRTIQNALDFKEIRDKGKYKCKIFVNPVSCIENQGREQQIIKYLNHISDSKVKMSQEIPIGLTPRVQPFFNSVKPVCNDTISLKSNGDILLCCYDIFGEKALGNMYENHINGIYKGMKLKILRYNLETGERLPYHCKICVGLANVIRN